MSALTEQEKKVLDWYLAPRCGLDRSGLETDCITLAKALERALRSGQVEVQPVSDSAGTSEGVETHV